jgi:hypothetical protein
VNSQTARRKFCLPGRLEARLDDSQVLFFINPDGTDFNKYSRAWLLTKTNKHRNYEE